MPGMTDSPDDGGTASAHRVAVCERTRVALARNPMVTHVNTDKAAMFGRPGFLSMEECDALVAMMDANAIPSTLFSGSEKQFRTSDSCNLDPYHPFIQSISDRICRMMAADPATGESLQGQRYQPSQEYRAHCDWFPVTEGYWPAMRASGGQRCWTAMIYLGDVAQGGETHFPHLGYKIPPRKGMILMWNNMRPDGSPNPMTLHAALPVVSGVKHVVTKWFRERPWTPASAA